MADEIPVAQENLDNSGISGADFDNRDRPMQPPDPVNESNLDHTPPSTIGIAPAGPELLVTAENLDNSGIAGANTGGEYQPELPLPPPVASNYDNTPRSTSDGDLQALPPLIAPDNMDHSQ